MKWLKYTLITVWSILLVSCYEVNEEIVINEDGSGTYVAKMDMSQLIDLFQSFAGEGELTKDGLDRPIDTLLLMKDILDSSKKVTPERKELMKDGKMRMQMNMKEKIFKMNMSVPYSNLGNLQKLMAGQGAGMNDLFQGFFGGKKEADSAQTDAPKEPGMDDVANIFDVTIQNGLISKKIDTVKYKALMARPEMNEVKQLASTGMEVLYTTTIKLPRPVKKSDNPLVKIAADKRTVTVTYNLLELLTDPGKFSYSIEY